MIFHTFAGSLLAAQRPSCSTAIRLINTQFPSSTHKTVRQLQRRLFSDRDSAHKTAPQLPPLTEIIVTQKAEERLAKILDKSCGERLRVEVDGGGCSGFEYKIRLDTKLNDDDLLWRSEKEGQVEIVVDKMSLEYMKGATIDYAEDLMKASFRVVKNPIAEKGCSCGSSFAVRLD